MPLVLEIAEESARRGAPGSWILDFTNPVGIVTQALLDAGHRAHRAVQRRDRVPARARRASSASTPERVALDHVGLNHLSWIRAVRVDGVDRLPELLEAGDAAVTLGGDFPLELVRALGAIPSYYLRYYYATDGRPARAARRARAGRPTSSRIERELLDLYRDPTLDHKPELLERRGGAYYSEAAAALIESLHTGDGAVHVVDVRNGGAIPNLPDDAVVEVPARIDRDGATPDPDRAAGARDARPRPARQGVRAAGDRGGDHAARTRSRCGRWSPTRSSGRRRPAALLDAIIEANLRYLARGSWPPQASAG